MQEAKSYLDKWFRNGLKNQISLRKTKEFSTIISESDPVDMEDAAEYKFTLSATGRAGEVWPSLLGDYSLTEEQHNGRPVYRNSGGPRSRHLWSQEDGTWAVSGNVGYDLPGMKSTDAAVSPGLCQQWQFMDRSDDYKYKPCDVIVTTINN